MRSMPRVRRALHDIENDFNQGNREELDNLIRAFRGIVAKDALDPKSFFAIAGFHGEPFRGEGATDPKWWGGYCNHGNVLFPTWHRAYLLRLENALREIPGCENVTIPFWDECFGAPSSTPIPAVLTSPTYELDGLDTNPLYSYKLQKALEEKVEGAGGRYSKHKDYETVRYPLSGLVGTEEDKNNTKIHNAQYEDLTKRTEILNANVANWLEGTVQITPDDPEHPTRQPDTYSVLERFKICLKAPNYTIFSNTTSAAQYIIDKGQEDINKHYVVSLESPHNAIHLAVGGFYQAGVYNADPIIGANGDMGDNETASFDPIFFLHHCFIDYVFWTWQKHHQLTAPGSLTVIEDYPGTISADGVPGIPPGSVLDMNTNLYPFKKPNSQDWYTSNDLTDINGQLGYEYGPGSFDIAPHAPLLGSPKTAPLVAIKRVHNISRADFAGSFVIRTFAKGPNGKRVEIGREPILSRWNIKGCANCQDKLSVQSFVPVDEEELKFLGAKNATRSDADIQYEVEVQTHQGIFGPGAPSFGDDRGGRSFNPQVGDL
ncbi:putative tyrosinase [Glonium stellatum]|uniref:tyrosinase n=1 Tax=Glonium stellatum TaxID=574774 RepID=A0A8E2F203_9PEZI|nr:putative tyrosinase [Glonium stellatum]